MKKRMTRYQYYRRLLDAVDSASAWAGAMEPEAGEKYRNEMRELKEEIKRRRRNARR